MPFHHNRRIQSSITCTKHWHNIDINHCLINLHWIICHLIQSITCIICIVHFTLLFGTSYCGFQIYSRYLLILFNFFGGGDLVYHHALGPLIIYMYASIYQVFTLPKYLKIIWLFNLFLTLSITDEGYSRNMSCTLNLIHCIYFFFIGKLIIGETDKKLQEFCHCFWSESNFIII